jgi:hypothetical protein
LDFVAATYDLPPTTADQREAIHETLIRRELDRARRIKAEEGGDDSLVSSEVSGSIQ